MILYILSKGEVKTLMIQLLRGVNHMHDNWILHRDIKASNLLLSHKGILKVSFAFDSNYRYCKHSFLFVVVGIVYVDSKFHRRSSEQFQFTRNPLLRT